VAAGGAAGDFLATTEILDVDTHIWTPKPLYGLQMLNVDCEVYIMGGTDDINSVSDVYRLDLEAFL